MKDFFSTTNIIFMVMSLVIIAEAFFMLYDVRLVITRRGQHERDIAKK